MIDITEQYRPPQAKWWSGRTDGEEATRYHEIIQTVNILEDVPFAHGKAVALIGFACDEGVRRNQGRPGARQGPEAFRKAFANLPVHSNGAIKLYDVGDVVCEHDDLEGAQGALADIVDALVKQGIIPIVIGGGHELAWGEFQGLALANPETSYSIINFDAHYDLRPLVDGEKGSSGTPFRQIATHCQSQGIAFDYTCIGIQRLGNTQTLIKEAESLGVHTVYAETMVADPDSVSESIMKALSKGNPLYLSICLDVFAAAAAPGVSAPQPLGIDPWLVIPHLRHLAQTGKIAAIGIAELSPPYDQDDRTAKLAAQLVATLLGAGGFPARH